MGGGGAGGVVVMVVAPGVEVVVLGLVVVVVVGGTGAGVVLATRFAMARISPVWVFITMAIPLLACDARISAPSDCSVTYWRGASIVSSTPDPGTAPRCVTVRPGMATPSGATSSVATPVWPASMELYWYSRPAAPAPASLTVPTRGPAMAPAGSMRCVSDRTLMPLRPSAATRWPRL